MCCSTGVCGTDIDPDLVNFAAMLSQLGTQGVKVERFNLAQQPLAFLRNREVNALLNTEGAEALPGTPEAYAADIASEEKKYGGLVRKLGLKVE